MSEHERHDLSDDELERFAQLLRDTDPAVIARPDPSSNGQPQQQPEYVLDDEIIFETLGAFETRLLPPSVSLVGAHRDGTNLLPQFGWVMPWGPAGSGKTSILVDLLFHAACGIDWLGYAIGRPLKIVAVVNEGIPGALQDKLKQKLERWEHDSALVRKNLAVYVSPWGEFTFTKPLLVEHARAFCTSFEADYIALDPLHTLGTSGAGAPDETEAFKRKLIDFGLWQNIGVITAHHANKMGTVSGDWDRHPDTVIHVMKEPKQPATKVTIDKARPADPAEHGIPFLLKWVVDTFGYEREELPTKSDFDENGLLEAVLNALDEASGPLTKTGVFKAVGGTKSHVLKLIDRALARGEIVDLTPNSHAFALTLPNRPEPSLLDDVENGLNKPFERFDEQPNRPEPSPEGSEVVRQFDPPVGGGELEPNHLAGNDDVDNNPFLD